MLLSIACSGEGPSSGGRHKGLGSKDLISPPEISTISGHLCKAVKAAYSSGAASLSSKDNIISTALALVQADG